MRRGPIRLSILADADTKKILAFVITEETIGESRHLLSLPDAGLKKLGIRTDKGKDASQIVILLGESRYDSGNNFSHCRELGVKVLMPVRVSANCRADNPDSARGSGRFIT